MAYSPILAKIEEMWMHASLERPEFIKKLTLRFPRLLQALAFLSGYALWILVFKVLSLTFVAYFVMSSGGADGSRFEEVNEALSSSEILIFALCAGGFLVVESLFSIYSSSPREDFFSSAKLEKQFLPGFVHGSVLAVGVTLAFLISGIYRYLGFFIQIDQAPIAVASILARTLSIVVLVYCEEYIFRKKLLMALVQKPRFSYNISAVVIVGVLYVAIKLLQFDLSWMQAISLLLVSVALGLRSLPVKESANGFVLAAGFWSALLIVFHAGLSLPIFGHDFSGLILIKYQAVVSEPSPAFWQPQSTYGETIRFLTGGAGGPLASFAFQTLIGLDIFRSVLRYKRYA